MSDTPCDWVLDIVVFDFAPDPDADAEPVAEIDRPVWDSAPDVCVRDLDVVVDNVHDLEALPGIDAEPVAEPAEPVSLLDGCVYDLDVPDTEPACPASRLDVHVPDPEPDPESDSTEEPVEELSEAVAEAVPREDDVVLPPPAAPDEFVSADRSDDTGADPEPVSDALPDSDPDPDPSDPPDPDRVVCVADGLPDPPAVTVAKDIVKLPDDPSLAEPPPLPPALPPVDMASDGSKVSVGRNDPV